MRVLFAFLLSLILSSTAHADATKIPLSPASEIVALQITTESFKGAINVQQYAIRAQITPQLKAMGVADEDIDTFIAVYVDELVAAMLTTAREAIADLYESKFTDVELGEILAFLKSDTGRKYTALSPELMQEGAQKGSLIGMKAGAEIMPRVMDRLGKMGIAPFADMVLDQTAKDTDL